MRKQKAATRAGTSTKPAPKRKETPAPAPGAAIHSRALLLNVSISMWSARRFDKVITEKVVKDLNTSADAGRWNKYLFGGDAPAYSAVVSAGGMIRQLQYDYTLPWDDVGWRLIPSAELMQHMARLREAISVFEQKRDEFVAAYPALVEQAKVRLNGMFKPSDYPSAKEMARRFGVTVEKRLLPTTGDFRLDGLAADQLADIKASVQSQVDRAVASAMQDAWGRLYEAVERIQQRLAESLTRKDGERVGFRNSMFDSAVEVASILGRLNVTNDPNLEAVRQRVLSELGAIDPRAVRDDREVRAEIEQKASAIMDAMAQFYTPPAKEDE